jgi:hypothetical protein
MGYLYATVPIAETVTVCPSGTSTVVQTGSRIVAYESIPIFVVSHRAKPEHPVLSPTGLVRGLETRRTARVHKYRQSNVPWSCPLDGVSGRKEFWNYSRVLPGFAIPQPTAPLTGWELGIRQKLESGATNIAESVYELRQTANLAHKGMKTLHKWWQQYRKLRKFKISPKPSDVASAVVIPSFVINPLLDEIGDAARILNDALTEPIIRRARWGTSERVYGESTVGTETTTGTWDRRLNAVFYGRLRVSEQRLTFGSPWELAWEVIPFSWTIDYFLGIGDWLCSLDALRGYMSVVGTVSNKVTYEGTNFMTPSDPTTQIHLTAGKRKDRSYIRTAYSTVPFPPRPVWKPHPTIMRLAIMSSVLCHLKRQQCDHRAATARTLRRR